MAKTTSVPRMATVTSASGVRARRPAWRTVIRVPSYDSVTGQMRRRTRTVRMEPMSTRVLLGGEGVAAHLDRGGEQHRAEEEERPRERGDELGTEGDEDAAQHERPGDADEQHPLLQLARHREGGEQQEEDEQVVDRE